MTTKRKTKAQREAEQKAALRQRVNDVFIGATRSSRQKTSIDEATRKAGQIEEKIQQLLALPAA